MPDPKSGALPLGDAPLSATELLTRSDYIMSAVCSKMLMIFLRVCLIAGTLMGERLRRPLKGVCCRTKCAQRILSCNKLLSWRDSAARLDGLVTHTRERDCQQDSCGAMLIDKKQRSATAGRCVFPITAERIIDRWPLLKRT